MADWRDQYAQLVAARTGLDWRVIRAQIQGEGHPGDEPGYFNPLNIATATAEYNGNQVVGNGPANTAQFGTLANGVDAAVREYKALGITKAAGTSPANQISAIASSGWASSHYGSPPGSNLVADFRSLFPNVSLGKIPPESGVFAPQPGNKIGLGPGVDSGVSGAVGAIESTGHFLGRLTDPSYILRGLQIVAGAGLAATGAVLLARQVALAADLPDPVNALAARTQPAVPPATSSSSGRVFQSPPGGG